MSGASSASDGSLHHHVIETERIGKLNVYVQGDIDQARKSDDKPIFLTVHDIGKNHNDWLNFVHHPSMLHVRERSVFIHVDLLGQEDEAEDLRKSNAAGGDAFVYPSMQQIGEDLINILDNLRIKMVIGMGDGAGSNIMIRFAAIHHTRCLGVVLINPTGTQATFMEQFKERLTHNMSTKIHSTPENYLVMHKFGHMLEGGGGEDDEEVIKAFEEYKEKLRTAKLTMSNVKLYVDVFLQRDDITNKLKHITDTDLLLVAGSKSSYASDMENLFSFADKTKTSQLKIDDVGDVLDEAPAKMAYSLLLFCKGLGWLTALAHSGVERGRTASQSSTGSGGGGIVGSGGRRMSMEEYDKPNIRRLSLSKGSD